MIQQWLCRLIKMAGFSKRIIVDMKLFSCIINGMNGFISLQKKED